jgi:membrane associated rhomboid family serine protease
MIPIRDDNPTFLTPYATFGIIALNALAWILVQGLGTPDRLAESVCTLGLIPGELLQTVPRGAALQVGPNAVCVLTDSAWYTVFTSMFLHGGWLHIIGNMWFLWIFGNNIEDVMGTPRFVAFYLLCGLAAAAAQIAADPASPIPMVGASGAIGGVMGAYVVLFPKVHVHMIVFLGILITRIAVPAFLMLGYWIVMQLLSGFGSLGSQGGGVAFWAHIGGFVAGVVLIYVFSKPELLKRHPYRGWNPRRSPTQSWRRIDRW